MRRVIRKSIRRKEDGLDLALDVNADIAINVGTSQPGRAAPETPERPEEPARPDSNEEGNDR
jgi:hypothetical protein